MKERVIFFLCSNDQAQYLPYVHFVKTHINFFHFANDTNSMKGAWHAWIY